MKIIKTMNGWKVIKKGTRKSARTSDWSKIDAAFDQCYNEMQLEDWVLHYPPNITVKPKFKGSKIMFFKNKDDAEYFKRVDEIIVPCIATNASIMKFNVYLVKNIYTFWKYKRNIKKIEPISQTSPFGTYGADSIKCLE